MEVLTYSDYLLYVKCFEKTSILLCSDGEETYYADVNNIHDKCFRDVLADKAEIVCFLKDFINVKNTINLSDIEAYNTSFITSKYQNREADVVYKIKQKNAFILIEHQSKIDRNMPFRLMEYYTEILRTTNIKENKKMPIVIPIIIYTGKRKWHSNGYISQNQETVEGYEEGRLNVKYNLVQANSFNTKELLSLGTMLANMMIIENSNNTAELVTNLEKIIDNTQDEKKLDKLKSITKYILNKTLNKDDSEKIEKIIQSKEEEYNLKIKIRKIKPK